MSLADIQARAMSKMGRTAPGARSGYFAAADKARRNANLKADGYVIPFSEWMGHNNGPDWFASELYLGYCWTKGHEKAWAPPSQEIGVRRARKAEAIGMSYRDYVLEILEHGRYPQGGDAAMIFQTIAFYLFSVVMIAAAFMVIAARNPVHSVLFLILAFFNAAGLFVLMGAEFLAMILVVVYVGAVAVLFLFVVMMLDVDFAELKSGALQYLPVGALLGLILLAELVMVGGVWVMAPASKGALMSATPAGVSNTVALGRILYTDYIYYFQIAGLTLLVAMIGAIVLTLRTRPGVRRQSISRQNARTAADAMGLVDAKPGEGA